MSSAGMAWWLRAGMEDPGGVEPLGARIKSPLPDRSGLTLRVPAESPPARLRSAVVRLSAGRSAIELREMLWRCGPESNRLVEHLQCPAVPIRHHTDAGGSRHLSSDICHHLMVPAPGLEPGSAGVWDRCLCRLAKRAVELELRARDRTCTLPFTRRLLCH